MYRPSSVLLLFILISIAASCRKDNFELKKRQIGTEYFSSKKGSYVIYDVRQIVFDDFTNTSDTSLYLLREYIESDFFDNLNRPSKRIERYIKPKDSLNWSLNNVYYATLTSQYAERIEENKRLIKLSFPMSYDVFWNSNKRNNDPEQVVYYSLLDEPYKTGTFSFDSSVMVVSDPVINQYQEQSLEEVYVKHIGLISKKYVNIVKNLSGAKRGIKLYYTIKDYGF